MGYSTRKIGSSWYVLWTTDQLTEVVVCKVNTFFKDSKGVAEGIAALLNKGEIVVNLELAETLN